MNLIILGSTGNLGKQTLEVLQKHPGKFHISAATGHKNTALLAGQKEKFNIPLTATHTDIDFERCDAVINLLCGTAGITATKKALKQGKKVLLANKESLIAEGKEIISLAQKDQIIPLDSEHNAIYEILKANPGKKIAHITLPCSGGPFLHKDLTNLTVNDALKHPRWNMGPKISIESALLLNKGFEILEAHFLFDLPLEKIHVKIHPECQIHGMVTFADKTTYAYISNPDMREHIENGLMRLLNPDKTPLHAQQAVKKVSPHSLPWQLTDPPHEKLPGIKIVLNAFKKGEIKRFLEEEERVIHESLSKNNIKGLVQSIISIV